MIMLEAQSKSKQNLYKLIKAYIKSENENKM